MNMKKILLIEDNKEMRENIAEILELDGYEVVKATNGKEGVSAALHENPDLILCDIMMPELDGYGVLHMLSKNSQTAPIPFIFLTAKAERSDYRMGMGMGADDYLTKPFDDIELLNAVQNRLKRSEILRGEFKRTPEGLAEFFKGAVSADVIKLISVKKVSRFFKKKELLYSEGAHAKGIFFLTSGKIKTYKMNEDGKEYITGLYKEGDFIGYTSLLEDSTYLETASVLEDAELITIPRDEFFMLLFNNREVASKFIKMLSNNVMESEERLIKLAYHSVRKRVAEALLMLQRKYHNEGSGDFSMPIAREDIANMVGTATETVIRTLSDFKEEKLIIIRGSNITIIDSEKLEKMKN